MLIDFIYFLNDFCVFYSNLDGICVGYLKKHVKIVHTQNKHTSRINRSIGEKIRVMVTYNKICFHKKKLIKFYAFIGEKQLYGGLKYDAIDSIMEFDKLIKSSETEDNDKTYYF